METDMQPKAQIWKTKNGYILEVENVGRFEVKGKREARKLCNMYNWKAWNF